MIVKAKNETIHNVVYVKTCMRNGNSQIEMAIYKEFHGIVFLVKTIPISEFYEVDESEEEE